MRTSLPPLAVGALTAFALGFAPVPSQTRKTEVFVQKFTVDAKDAAKGYGRFAYETTTPGWKAEVRGGRLRLLGDHPEGDQRLFITARKALGKPKWPDSLEVTARLGGTDGDCGAWHVGVSVGAVKVLFHPGYSQGAFRAETVDKREEFVGNQDMGFTPAAGVIHQLTVKVRRTNRGYRFEAELANANGGAYRKTFEVSSKQVGGFDRVGLERSGRRGGDAVFESVTIRQGK
jgi:hypothetical protein